MPYIIQDSQGRNVIVPDFNLNQEYSIDLVGRNYANYGSVIATTQLRLLENFANDDPPTRPTSGQLWYDIDSRQLRVYDDNTDSWAPLLAIVSDVTPPRTYNQTRQDGLLYFNTDESQLYVSSNNDWIPVYKLADTSSAFSSQEVIGFPTVYGTRLRTIFLEDTLGVSRAVFAVCYSNNGTVPGVTTNNEKIMAIFSGHASAFTVSSTDNSVTDDQVISYFAELSETGGIGTVIVPGLNLRSNNQTRVSRADHAESANVAFAINTGSLASPGVTIDAIDVYHNASNIVPTATNQYTVGSSDIIFSEGYFGDLRIGNSSDGSILPYDGSAVNIGSESEEIQSIYAQNIYASGSVFFDQDLGSDVAPVQNIYVNNLTANTVTIGNYTMPTSDGNVGFQIYTNGDGSLFWAAPASNIADVVAGDGLTSNRTLITSAGPSGEITQEIITLDIGAGTGISANTNAISVDLSVFSSDDLSEGNTNRYYSDTLSRNALTGGNGITYNNLTGEISLTVGELGFTGNVVAGLGLIGGGPGFTVELNVGGGDGIIVAADTVSVSSQYVRGLFNVIPGSGLSYNATTGVFSYSSSSAFDGLDPADFVTRSGTQTITGPKTFTSTVGILNGIAMDGSDFTYTGTLTFTGQGGTVGFSSTGAIVASGDITAFSDARLKENLEPISDAVDKVNQLTGYTYTRNDTDSNDRHAGLIAQEVEKVLPEVVHEQDNGLKSVAYGNMLALMVQAIKELSQEVNELKKELNKDV
jgi:hypothetical protein